MKMNAIIWPEGFVPGECDNYCSNEVIIAGLSVADVWPLLNNATLWPTYYNNAADIRFHDVPGPELAQGVRFFFKTFGIPIEAKIVEHIAPKAGEPARMAWHAWAGEGDNRLDAYHAWLFEDLPGGRVRLLTQETQNGEPAKELGSAHPNPMLNAHQDWLDGLASAARKKACVAV